jgi:hypothetical protein
MMASVGFFQFARQVFQAVCWCFINPLATVFPEIVVVPLSW